MPEFANPFIGKVPERKFTSEELIRAIRLDLAAEEEAIHQYMAHADAAEHPLARKVLVDVANEDKWLADGAAEVNEAATEISTPGAEKATPSGGEEPTIGSLKD
jgi:rubrerythrin